MDVINALRGLGGRATLEALVLATGKTDRRLRYALADLRERGRVERFVEDPPKDLEQRDALHLGHAIVTWILREPESARIAASRRVSSGAALAVAANR